MKQLVANQYFKNISREKYINTVMVEGLERLSYVDFIDSVTLLFRYGAFI